MDTTYLFLGTKKAATRQSKSTPENGSSQVQSRAVADGVPQAIIDFEDNEKNRKILDELFELLLEDPCINGEHTSRCVFIKYLIIQMVLFCSIFVGPFVNSRCWCSRRKNQRTGSGAD